MSIWHKNGQTLCTTAVHCHLTANTSQHTMDQVQQRTAKHTKVAKSSRLSTGCSVAIINTSHVQ